MRESRGAGDRDFEYDLERERGEGDRCGERDLDRAGSWEGALLTEVGVCDRVRERPRVGDGDLDAMVPARIAQTISVADRLIQPCN